MIPIHSPGSQLQQPQQHQCWFTLALEAAIWQHSRIQQQQQDMIDQASTNTPLGRTPPPTRPCKPHIDRRHRHLRKHSVAGMRFRKLNDTQDKGAWQHCFIINFNEVIAVVLFIMALLFAFIFGAIFAKTTWYGICNIECNPTPSREGGREMFYSLCMYVYTPISWILKGDASGISHVSH